MAENIIIGRYEILLTGKSDGSTHLSDHRVHTEYMSVQQVHGDVLCTPHNFTAGSHTHIEADALLTTENLPLGVYMADCVSIALLGKYNYALLHGSRKTLRAGLLKKTVKNLCRQDEHLMDIVVYLSPSIRGEVYQVGEEFVDYFPSETLTKRDDGRYFDMIVYIRLLLAELGFTSDQIIVHPDCTYQQNNKRWSYRRGEKGMRNFMGVKVV